MGDPCTRPLCLPHPQPCLRPHFPAWSSKRCWAAELGAAAVKGGAMTRFEKECDDSVLRYLANLRMMYFGPELPVWYLSVEETNIIDVRMILTGLLAGIDPQRLRERLRETYV